MVALVFGGESPMSAHPQLKLEEVTTIVNYILTLDPNSIENRGLSLKGEVTFTKHIDQVIGGQYILTVAYQDNGLNNIESTKLSTTKQVVFTASDIK